MTEFSYDQVNYDWLISYDCNKQRSTSIRKYLKMLKWCCTQYYLITRVRRCVKDDYFWNPIGLELIYSLRSILLREVGDINDRSICTCLI